MQKCMSFDPLFKGNFELILKKFMLFARCFFKGTTPGLLWNVCGCVNLDLTGLLHARIHNIALSRVTLD